MRKDVMREALEGRLGRETETIDMGVRRET